MPARTPGRVVTLVRRGGRPACVMLPGAGGGIEPYVRLARHIGSTHDVFVVRAAGLVPGEAPERSIDAMAESAVAALDDVGITPRLVFGWSLGGSVAWEICVRVARRGELPDLVLADASPLPQRPSKDAAARLLRRILAKLGPRPSAETVALVTRAFEAQLSALAAYRAREAYPGRVLVLTCTDGYLSGREAANDRWRALAPDLREERVAAGHFELLEVAHLPELAGHVATFLPAVTGAASC